MGHHSKKNVGATLTAKGAEFRVWAPFAKAVSVFVTNANSSDETYLESENDGYWSTFVPDVIAGQVYQFHIKTLDDAWITRNDPRARQLTSSENGESVIVDQSFDWDETKPPDINKENQVIYEIHIGTFNRPDPATSGTFDSAIERLDYLKELGITMIELMPVTSMEMSWGWGYAPINLFSVETMYGGRHGLLKFVKACHERGIGVILDVVYNHISGQGGLWQFDGWSENGRGGIYFYNDERSDTPWDGERPDYGREEVRQFILDNVTMWLTEYRLSGLRLDSTIYMRNSLGHNDDPSHDIPEAWSLLQDISSLAHKIKPDALLIAEDATNEYMTKSIDEGGAGFDAQWDVAFPLAIRKTFGMESHDFDLSLPFMLSRTFNGQHLGRVIYGDSHDTAGNGWARINESTTPGNAGSVFARQRSLIANALTLTAPGIPMILQGEEFLQQGSFNDWQMLDWDNAEKFSGIVQAHKDLIMWRKNLSALNGPSINIFHNDEANNVIAYHRWDQGSGNDDVIVIINCSDIRHKQYVLPLPIAGTWNVIFNSSSKQYSSDFNESSTYAVATNDESNIVIELADYNILILRVSTAQS